MEHKTYNIKSGAGFTIVEMVISMTIFMIMIGVVVSIFISVVQQQKRILKEQELLNQLSYAQEYMSKALRMAVRAEVTDVPDCLDAIGDIYKLTHCPTDGSGSPCRGIKFINGSLSETLKCQEFYVDDSTGLLIEKVLGPATPNILSSQLQIKYVRFILNGDKTKTVARASDAVQPRVTMLLDIKTPVSPYQQEKIIQTTVTQRNLNKQ